MELWFWIFTLQFAKFCTKLQISQYSSVGHLHCCMPEEMEEVNVFTDCM